MKLITPDVEFAGSYHSYIAEIGDQRRVPFTLDYDAEPFSALNQKLQDHSMGLGIDNGFVANTSFWLVKQNDIVGVSNLRHELTDHLRVNGGHIGFGVRPSIRRQGVGTELLRQTLLKARDLGLSRVLLTCESWNTGSIGVITANNGVFQDEELDPETGELIRRYWIDLVHSHNL